MKNSLVYTTTRTKNGIDYIIKIRLNDECKNGHQDFAITADKYKAGKARIDRNFLGGWAIGDEIAVEFPEFAIFNPLQLCDWKGIPMHAVSNGYYHLKNTGKEVFMDYLRINEAEYDALKDVGDEKHLAVLLVNMGIKARWEDEARAAIAELERLTGDTFLCDSVRDQWGIDDAKMEVLQKQFRDGYWTPDKVMARADAKREKQFADRRREIEEQRDNVIRKETFEASLKLAILDLGILCTNYIYYSHNDTFKFNWLDYSSAERLTDAEIESITNMLHDKFPQITVVGHEPKAA